MSLTVANFIQEKFNAIGKQLDGFYPGITYKRLLEEFLNFTHLKVDELYLGQGDQFFIHLEKGYPFEYIKKSAYFYRSNFYVNEFVLIPRSETEILVEDALNYLKKNNWDQPKIAEVGVGSFCIGLSLMSELTTPITYWGGDICEKALSVAKLNQFRLKSKIHPETKIDLEVSDRLEKAQGSYHMILSNPPYIKKEGDLFGVHQQAFSFEPHLALFLEDVEYEKWYDDFFKTSFSKLNSGGVLLLEGHEDNLDGLDSIAQKYYKHTLVKDDYTGRPRFLHCIKD